MRNLFLTEFFILTLRFLRRPGAQQRVHYCFVIIALISRRVGHFRNTYYINDIAFFYDRVPDHYNLARKHVE